MLELAIVIGLLLLWSIARSLRRIARILRTFKIEQVVPIVSPGGPGERKPDNIVKFPEYLAR